jgi:hypothetical protein
MSIIRTRWAAIGAAIAVTLGAGGIGIVSATQPDDAVTFVPITPCRVMDTRTEFNVGPKTSPLGPGEVYTVNTTTGNTGNCSGIPTTATGVSLNITALDATLPTFLTVWATGAPQPEASSLNPIPGQPPTPNAVTTGINTNGQFDIYNLQGNVQVIADINGYYTDHHHDDRYYTKNQTDDRYYTKGQSDDRYYTKGQSDDRYYTKSQSDQMLPFVAMSDAIASSLTTAATIVQSVEVNAPSAGNVLLNYSVVVAASPGDRIFCNVGTGATVEDTNGASVSEIPSTRTTLVGTRMIAVSAGSTTVNLVCRLVIGTGTKPMSDPTITALFVPTGA